MSSPAFTIALYLASAVQVALFAAIALFVNTVRALREDMNAMREHHVSLRVTLFGETGTNGMNGQLKAVQEDLKSVQKDVQEWRAGIDAERRLHDRRA